MGSLHRARCPGLATTAVDAPSARTRAISACGRASFVQPPYLLCSSRAGRQRTNKELDRPATRWLGSPASRLLCAADRARKLGRCARKIPWIARSRLEENAGAEAANGSAPAHRGPATVALLAHPLLAQWARFVRLAVYIVAGRPGEGARRTGLKHPQRPVQLQHAATKAVLGQNGKKAHKRLRSPQHEFCFFHTQVGGRDGT